jgi:excisionase family DNA binding protein
MVSLDSSIDVPLPYRGFIVSDDELLQEAHTSRQPLATLVEEPELFEQASSETLIGIREAARRLGVHENTIRHWAERGLIQFTRLPGSGFRRLSAMDVERLHSQMLHLLNDELRIAGVESPEQARGRYQGGGGQMPRDEGW